MLRDSQELAVTTDSLETVSAINEFFDSLLSVSNAATVRSAVGQHDALGDRTSSLLQKA